MEQQEINWELAYKYAILSRTVYEKNYFIDSVCLGYGYTPVSIEVKNSFCFVASGSNENVIAFRGTDDFKDALQDLTLKKMLGIFDFLKFKNRNVNDLKIHCGFFDCFSSLFPLAKEALNKLDTSKPLVITGHSLGGALAVLAGFYLSSLFNNITIYVYGCPRVGKGKFNRLLEDAKTKTGLKIINIQNDGDPVTQSPPILFGWKSAKDVTKIGNRLFFLRFFSRTKRHLMDNYITSLMEKINIKR